MRIGIDFDDVISKTGELLFEEMGTYFGRTLDYHTTREYGFEKLLHISTEQVWQAFKDIHQRYSFHQKIQPMNDCLRVLKYLKKNGHHLFIVSARRTWVLPYSTVWLKEQGILPLIDQVIHRPSDDTFSADYKAKQAKVLAFDLFIEDAPLYAQKIAEYGIPVILFDAPYNRSMKLPKNMYRIKGWKEVPGIINKLEARMKN